MESKMTFFISNFYVYSFKKRFHITFQIFFNKEN